MKTITLRNIDENLDDTLKKLARETGSSVNSVIISTLNEALGLNKKKFSKEYTDLDSLAGTWSAAEHVEFTNNTEFFNRIDEEMWK
jgi:hypothetical protein